MRRDLRPRQAGRVFGVPLTVQTLPLCPEISLLLVAGEVDLETECARLGDGVAPPFWAFCWGAGQALARYVLDTPEVVAGRSVLDVGTGSGVVAIAAALAGARRVCALDTDTEALAAARANAARNGVEIEVAGSPAGGEGSAACTDADLVLAADVHYEAGPRELVGRALLAGREVVAAEPERSGLQQPEGVRLARYEARTVPDVDSPTHAAVVYRIALSP